MFGLKQAPKSEEIDEQMFDQQYQAYLKGEKERGGNYHTNIQTEIQRGQAPMINSDEKGGYHTPFEGIDLDDKVDAIAVKAKK